MVHPLVRIEDDFLFRIATIQIVGFKSDMFSNDICYFLKMVIKTDLSAYFGMILPRFQRWRFADVMLECPCDYFFKGDEYPGIQQGPGK